MELEKQAGREGTRAVATIPKQGQLTQPQAEHILSLVYPGCPKDEIIRCAILCRDFGLHPLMKEVYLIPFKDKKGEDNYVTVLGINATRKLMARRGTYSYTDDTPRLMTGEEQKRIFGEVDAKNIVAITKLRTKDGLNAPGYGKWPKDKEPYGTDKGNTKANMAFIRSERNAFGRLSPDAIPPDVEIIDEAYAEVPDVREVDLETGEIIEGEAKVIEDESQPKPMAPYGICPIHNIPLVAGKGDYPPYCRTRVPGTGRFAGKEVWCRGTAPKEEVAGEKTAEDTTTPPEFKVDMPWLIESVNKLNRWDIKTYIKDTYAVSTDGTLKDVVGRLSPEQQGELVKEVEERLSML